MSLNKIIAGKAYVSLEIANNLRAGLSRAKRQLAGFSKSATLAGGAMTAGAGLAARGMYALINSYAGFDDKMRSVNARLIDSSIPNLEMLTRQARHLGETTSYTAVQVAGLMEKLAQGGLSAKQVSQITPHVMNLARATGVDAAQAANYVVETMGQFGLGAHEAERAVDVLGVTAQSSLNTIEDIGEALKYAGTQGQLGGQSLETVAAIMGELGNAGQHASIAGRQLRKIIIDLSTKGEDIKKLWGIDVKDDAGNLRDVATIMGEINMAMKGMGNTQKIEEMNKIFGRIAITAAGILSGDEAAKRVNSLRDRLKGAEGDIAKVSKDMDAGIGGALRKMWSAIEGVVLSIGDSMVPMVTTLTEMFINIANTTSEWAKENAWVAGLFVAMVPLIGAAGAALLVAGGAGFALVGAITAVNVLLGATSAILAGIAALFASPVALAVLGVAATVAMILTYSNALGDTWESLSSFFTDVWQSFYETGSLAIEGVISALENGDFEAAFGNAMKGITGILADTLVAFEDAFGSTFESLFHWIYEGMGQVGKFILELEKAIRRVGIVFTTFSKEETDAAVKEMEKSIDQGVFGTLATSLVNSDKTSEMLKNMARADVFNKSLNQSITNQKEAAKARREAAAEERKKIFDETKLQFKKLQFEEELDDVVTDPPPAIKEALEVINAFGSFAGQTLSSQGVLGKTQDTMMKLAEKRNRLLQEIKDKPGSGIAFN